MCIVMHKWKDTMVGKAAEKKILGVKTVFTCFRSVVEQQKQQQPQQQRQLGWFVVHMYARAISIKAVGR